MPIPSIRIATLNIWNSPVRRQANPTLEIPVRVDWIMLQVRPGASPPRVLDVDRFGLEPAGPEGVVASDHYGVHADLLV